jgi:putative ABC transport system permease protein
MAAFIVCLSMVVFFVGVYRFRIVDGVSKSTRYRSGHLQVHARGYDAIARKLPLSLTVPDPRGIVSAFRADGRVKVASERIRFFCHLSRGEEMLNAGAMAIDPAVEGPLSLLPETVVKGRYLRPGDAGLMMPERTARLLKAQVGDVIRLKARTRFDVANVADAVVIGIVRPPFNSLDQTLVFVPIAFARELLGMEGMATEIVVMADSVDEAGALLSSLPARLAPEARDTVELFDWRHYEPALVADIYIDTRFLAFFFTILLLISIFIMNNSMSMTVFERMREFGTMRALGMSKNLLLGLVSTESILIGAMGSIAGCILGALLCWYFGVYGIPTDVGELSSIPVSPRFYTISRPIEYVGCLLLGAFLGWLGGLRAALRARSLHVVDVLRAE